MKKIMITAIVATMLLSVTTFAQPNLIVNGDFESGNTGFLSDYTYAAPGYDALWPEEYYTVYTNTNASGWVHHLWTDYGDHTTGTGLMLIVNGAESVTPGSEPTVWGQDDITVEQDRTYILTYYLRTCYPAAPATLRCTINGIQVGPDAEAPDTPGDGWLEVSYEWDSGSNTEADIRLVDLNYEHTGNDFTIDDISFYTVKATIEKEMADEGELGDHITITLNVDNPYEEAITVEDVLPDGLAYIPDIDPAEGNQNLQVDGEYVTPTIIDNTISVEVEPGEHEIVFVVQVVEVQCEEVEVTNVANVYNPDEVLDDSAEADITLYPYDGFVKVVYWAYYVDDWDGDSGYLGDEIYPWDVVPMETQVFWVMYIWVYDMDIVGQDILVKDNLGGDLTLYNYDGSTNEVWQELVPYYDSELGVFEANTKGKTDKIQMTWEVEGFDGDAFLVLLVGTDINPGQGKKSEPKWEYTEAGPHDLNSGATLKFVDPDTGLQLSAHTCPITVTAEAPPMP